MTEVIERFERITRSTEKSIDSRSGPHPFDILNIHPEIQRTSKELFDDEHFLQATFEAFKFVESRVQTESRISDSLGKDLMMKAFDENNGKIKLARLTPTMGKNEQMGYKFIFAGSMSAIRNPRAHQEFDETSEECLDHLALASFLVKVLEKSVRTTSISVTTAKPKAP